MLMGGVYWRLNFFLRHEYDKAKEAAGAGGIKTEPAVDDEPDGGGV
jgi:hypothetical protein